MANQAASRPDPLEEIARRSYGAWQAEADFAQQPCCCDEISQPPCAPCQARAYLGREDHGEA